MPFDACILCTRSPLDEPRLKVRKITTLEDRRSVDGLRGAYLEHLLGPVPCSTQQTSLAICLPSRVEACRRRELI